MDPTPVFQHHDAIFLPNGTLLRTHPESACAGGHCCIHNPSDHPLRDAPLVWWSQLNFMDRVCAHDGKHPDPDALAFKAASQTPQWLLLLLESHDCDGCCRRPTEDEDETK